MECSVRFGSEGTDTGMHLPLAPAEGRKQRCSDLCLQGRAACFSRFRHEARLRRPSLSVPEWCDNHACDGALLDRVAWHEKCLQRKRISSKSELGRCSEHSMSMVATPVSDSVLFLQLLNSSIVHLCVLLELRAE